MVNTARSFRKVTLLLDIKLKYGAHTKFSLAFVFIAIKVEGKAIPLQALRIPEG